MRRHKKLWIALGSVAAALAVFVALGLRNRLTETFYTIESGKVNSPVRAALITDLHSCFHGDGQADLLALIDAAEPDIVLLAGDIIDDWMPNDGTIAMLEGLRGYETFYVTGNHEIWRRQELGEIKDIFRSYGVTVLEGDIATLELRGQRINVCGVDDPDVGTAEFVRQLESASAAVEPEVFTILLSHRPERLEQYAEFGFDLVVSGHAHGGQWRLPFINRGFVAPNQGFFPAYTCGVYEQGGTRMLVGRGLSRESTRIPRFYNPPEVIFIDIVPEGA